MEHNTQTKEDIIIIGAGASGLMAGRELSSSYHVTILEANDVLGGRINTVHGNGFSQHVEEGAEFVHGKLPLSLALLEEAGIIYHEVEGDVFQVSRGIWKEQNEMIEGWNDLLQQMGALKDDTTMGLFLEQYYGEERYGVLRTRVRNYVHGFDVADVNRVSVKALYKEWVNEDEENYRPEGGYGRLIEFLADSCRKNGAVIHTGAVAKRVEWKKGRVSIYTEDGKIYNAQKVIITVPVSVLQNKDARAAIKFEPAINDYLSAAAKIGTGNVIKVILEFRSPFWNDQNEHIGFILSEEKIPTWWTRLPGKEAVLTGWLGGPPADAVSNESDDHILGLAMESLANIFGKDRLLLDSMLVKGLIVNWGKNEWALGAYSYATPESTAAKETLNLPVEEALFFSGEALYSGKSPGTVEAALSSGKTVARKILEAQG